MRRVGSLSDEQPGLRHMVLDLSGEKLDEARREEYQSL
jgi:hypothetical protein